MKKTKYSFMVVLALSFTQTLPITKQQDNFLKRQYKSLKSDLELIKKCYGTTSPACTDNERKEARKAALRVGAKGTAVVLALAAVIGGGIYGGYKLFTRQQEEKLIVNWPDVDAIIGGHIQNATKLSKTFLEIEVENSVFNKFYERYNLNKKIGKDLLDQIRMRNLSSIKNVRLSSPSTAFIIGVEDYEKQ